MSSWGLPLDWKLLKAAGAGAVLGGAAVMWFGNSTAAKDTGDAGAVPKKLVNDPRRVVPEMIEGLLAANRHLARLDGFPDIKVVVRSDWDQTCGEVALISGGGSGHEPAHIGYVGKGMLTAAVAGEVYASPSPEAVLAAIRAVDARKGVLLIVKNYTGDRLSFGLAMEQARAEGHDVEMVIVADDAGIPDAADSMPGRRGIAGTVLVHKIAGAAAAAGKSLAEVTVAARAAAASVRSMGVALSTCGIPGRPKRADLGRSDMELGMGIHGEPGRERCRLQPVDAVVDGLLAVLAADAGVGRGARVVLLMNNLGGSTAMELAVATRRALSALAERGLAVERVYSGSYMTALDMAGLSVSLLRVDDASLALLDAPAATIGWQSQLPIPVPSTGLVRPLPPNPRSPSATTAPADARTSSAASVTSLNPGRAEGALRAIAGALAGAESELTEYDTLVGDGDCGQTLRAGADALIARLESGGVDLTDASALLLDLEQVCRHMGGSSGALYAIFVCAAANAMRESDGAGSSAEAWARALSAGVEAMMRIGGARRGDCTMVDALAPAAEAALRAAAASGASLLDVAEAAAAAAEAGAEATRGMRARAGRSSYLAADKTEGVPDPGAVAVARWMRALAAK